MSISRYTLCFLVGGDSITTDAATSVLGGLLRGTRARKYKKQVPSFSSTRNRSPKLPACRIHLRGHHLQDQYSAALVLSKVLHLRPKGYTRTSCAEMQRPWATTNRTLQLLSEMDLQVESIFHSPTLKPPGATNTLFLAGAGARYFELDGKVLKVTAVSVYLEDKAIQSLAVKWKGKTPAELMDSDEFYEDVVTGPFEKLTQVSMLIPMPGKNFSRTISQLWVAILKENGTYVDADAATIDKFLEAFKDEIFTPGASVLFTSSPAGSVTVNLVKDGTISEAAIVVFENEKWGATVAESVIGKNGVSQEAKQSAASRVFEFLN
nr:chalcone isomerase [Tanacetum cinerariifolium]